LAVQPIEQQAAPWISECLEHDVQVGIVVVGVVAGVPRLRRRGLADRWLLKPARHALIMQPKGCLFKR
jgi:hypothetical protein